jgi:uracil-DNA glycosylase
VVSDKPLPPRFPIGSVCSLGCGDFVCRFGLLGERPGGADGKRRGLRFMGRAGESLEYWQGE